MADGFMVAAIEATTDGATTAAVGTKVFLHWLPLVLRIHVK